MRAPAPLVAMVLVASAFLGAGCLDPQDVFDHPFDPVVGGSVPLFGALINVTGPGHRETSLALSPTDPSLIFLCDPSGVPNTSYKQSYFYRSTDAGETWEKVIVKTEPTDPRQATFEGGDCDVAFDKAGTMYSADSWLGSISVGASRDGGKTWTTGTPLAGLAPVADRPWLVGGPGGTVHLTYQDLQCCMPSAIWYARSTDYGRTFTPPVSVAAATAEGEYTWEGNYVVSPDAKQLHLIYTRRPDNGGSLETYPPDEVYVASSRDGGASWTSKLVSKREGPASFLYPSIGLDKGGILHAVWAERTKTDHPIFYSYSKDEARTWSKPVKLLEDVGAYSPWIEGGEKGQAAVQWYGTDTPLPDISKKAPWWTFWAQVRGADADELDIVWGTTTKKPIFNGVQGETPEFNQIRLDAEGRMHFGVSYRAVNQQNRTVWQIGYQVQSGGPTV